ncbi:MAG TPA: ferrous iron transport protein A [Helicobacteraceae bacterium]|nr:ferrous iron transport protein A [Helicobacteraceae bacterium]
MCLLELKKGENALIDAIHVDEKLKYRLNALGMRCESKICVKQYGWFKSTVQVMINRTLIALRKDEARLIEVHVI